jgi:hypothetical protein
VVEAASVFKGARPPSILTRTGGNPASRSRASSRFWRVLPRNVWTKSRAPIHLGMENCRICLGPLPPVARRGRPRTYCERPAAIAPATSPSLNGRRLSGASAATRSVRPRPRGHRESARGVACAGRDLGGLDGTGDGRGPRPRCGSTCSRQTKKAFDPICAPKGVGPPAP